MTKTEMNRMELLKGIKGYKQLDIIVGVETEGIYELHIDTTRNYFSIRADVYRPFETEISNDELYDCVEDYMNCLGFNYNLEIFLEQTNIYKNDIIDSFIENMNEDEKLEWLHSDIVQNSEFEYEGGEYMLELSCCGQHYLNKDEFIYILINKEETKQLQNIWEKAHLKDLNVLNDNELEFLYNFMKKYENSENLFDILENDEIVEILMNNVENY